MTVATRLKSKVKTFDYGILFIVLFLMFMAVIMALPLIFLISTAFKPLSELFIYPPTFLVRNPTPSNFVALTSSVSASMVPFSRYALNSVIITASVVFLVVMLCSLAAYPLARHTFPGKNFFFGLIIASLMFAPEVLEIPKFIVISNLNIINTYLAVIIPQLAFPLGLFLLKQFMEQIPNAIFEAAYIDGAGEFKLFTQIALPQVRPAWATVAILVFIQAWGDASSGLLIQNETLKPLTYFLSTVGGQGVAMAGAAAAASLVSVAPPILIFVFFQRKVVSTMAYSGIK